MSVQYYTAAFDQAMWAYVASIGYDARIINESGEGWVDVRHITNFQRELRTGESFQIETKPLEIFRSSISLFHEMRTYSGEVVATMQMISVYFDVQNRKSLPLPEKIRAALLSHLQAV